MKIEQRVLLLGLYKKKNDETFNDTVLMLEDSGVFTKKEGKRYLKNLKNDGFITDENLTMIGVERAKEIEIEFRL